MFAPKNSNSYRKVGNRLTRLVYNYEFAIDAVCMSIYSKSLYYRGAILWNGLPNDIRTLASKEHHEHSIKKSLKNPGIAVKL